MWNEIGQASLFRAKERRAAWHELREPRGTLCDMLKEPPRTSAIQQQSCSSQEIQRIASLHLAETLRPTALPQGRALHL